jgi:hypothetical protein
MVTILEDTFSMWGSVPLQIFIGIPRGSPPACLKALLAAIQKALKALDEREGFFKLRKLTLLGLEGGGMDATAQAAHSYRMLEV